ncbi:MAG: AcrIF11 family anti-CRISPR ADP-ribosyltransferase [Candidatus Methanospirareceae archaeon]
MVLYNGGSEIIKEVLNGYWELPNSIVDGLFASDEKETASAHGNVITTFDIEDEDIAESCDLDCLEAYSLLEKELEISRDDDDFDDIYDSIVDDDCNEEVMSRFSEQFPCGDNGEWFNQSIRGRLAKALGYKAVEMEDEHGTSYYIVPGVKSINSEKE